MRKLLLILLLISSMFSTGQDHHGIDSLKQVLSKQKEDTLKVQTLQAIGWSYIFNRPDSAIMYAEQGLQLAKKINYTEGEAMNLLVLYGSELVKGNYYKAINIGTQRLRIYEEANDIAGIADAYGILFNCYRDMGDYKTALQYVLREKKIEDSLGVMNWGTYGSLGDAYEKTNQLDSALAYEQKAYELELKENGGNYTWIPYILGNIHSKLHSNELALAYYHAALSRALKNSNYKDIIDVYNSRNKIFTEENQMDSVIYYSKEALKYHNTVSYTKGAQEAAATLAKMYKFKNNNDSSLKYFELSSILKDSLYSQEKTMQVQNLAFTEQERQREIGERSLKEKKQRAHNLQYALIGIGLISFLILFFLLSRSIIVRTGLIKFLGIVALLLVFEFINLYIHPYLIQSTNDSPLLMLLVMVCIAALLVPAHHRLEKWVTFRLVEKNKKIRLTAAKKTIARLEG